MKNWMLISLTSMTLMVGCKEKETKATEDVISFRTYLNSQIANVDTSLYSIMRLDYIDSTRIDTTYIKREDFRKEAREFLELPDIADKKNQGKFRKETRYDEMLNSVIITYYPENPENSVIQRQEMLITPDPTGDRVRNIFVDYLLNNRDSMVQKRMLWLVDRSFQVTTIKQKPGQPETIATTKVVWNEPASE